MSRIIPHIAFFLVYAGLLSFVGFAAGQLAGKATNVISWVAPFLSAPLALLVAIRLGSIGRIGVAVASALLLLFTCALTVSVLVAVAAPVAQINFEYIVEAFVSFFSLGGWGVLWSSLFIIAAPLLWSPFLQKCRRATPRAAA